MGTVESPWTVRVSRLSPTTLPLLILHGPSPGIPWGTRYNHPGSLSLNNAALVFMQNSWYRYYFSWSLWYGIDHYVRPMESTIVVVPVAHCVVGGTRPAQAACSLVVCLEHMSYLNIRENIMLTTGRYNLEHPGTFPCTPMRPKRCVQRHTRRMLQEGCRQRIRHITVNIPFTSWSHSLRALAFVALKSVSSSRRESVLIFGGKN